MTKRLAVVLGLLAVLSSSAAAQEEGPLSEDLRFVRELRSRGYSDLAREYLGKLAKSGPAELKKELPLEVALTNLEAANEEPDSNKRIALYQQARAEFEKFLKDNPTHPRAREARLDIARATTLQGKAQLNRALLEDDLKARIAEGLKARAIFIDAFNQLKAQAASPETELAMALNLLDQADTYLNTGSDKELIQRGKPVQEAQKILEKLAQGESASKTTWLARAWLGRCIDKLDEPKKAIAKYLEVTSSTAPAARDARRLARYFILLAYQKTKEAPSKQPLHKYLSERTSDWLREYGSYRHTPEGFGVQFLLAETLLTESEDPKLAKRDRDALVAKARARLTEIERTENEFTDRAKRLKITAMAKQGLFQVDVDKLATFEDCYVRAQYEQMQMGEDAAKFKEQPSQAEAKRKERVQAIIKALQNGLAKPDAKEKSDAKGANSELYNARALLSYYLLNEGKYREAIAVGEGFARKNPGPTQASSAAIYALISYGQLLGQREGKADAKTLQDDRAYQDDKSHMLALAKYMEERWPKDRAGDLARHEISLRLLREEKTAEAIKELSAITAEYPSYVRTQFLLARTCLFQAAQDKDRGDPEKYRDRALTILQGLREPAPSAEAEVNYEYVQARLMLLSELARDKKFAELEKIAAELAPKVQSLRLVADPTKEDEKKKEEESRKKFSDTLSQLTLYATAIQAENDSKAAKYADVIRRLDPLVDQFLGGKLPALRDSGMGPAVIALDLRANVQLNNLQRARQAIKALQTLQTDKDGDKGADNTTAILGQLVNLISQQVEELRKKGDKDNLKKAQEGFTSILNDVVGTQQKPTAKLAYLMARCYAGMDEHKKAVDLLKPFAAQSAAGADAALSHAIQILLVQEYRQTRAIDEAQKLLNEILNGKENKPGAGWGAKDLGAQKLRVQLLEDKGEYATAALLCDKFVKQLVRRLEDNKLREQYFEFYYHLVYCIYKHGQGLDDADKKGRATRDAAQRIVALEKAQGGRGTEESKKRFDELLDRETPLREQYNALKK